MLRMGSASSLDVERKHYQDNRTENSKVTRVVRGSRNSILQRYRVGRGTGVVEAERRRRTAKRQRHMNPRALAIKKIPELFGPARGDVVGKGRGSSRQLK